MTKKISLIAALKTRNLTETKSYHNAPDVNDFCVDTKKHTKKPTATILLVVSSALVITLHKVVSNRHSSFNVRTAVVKTRPTTEDILLINMCKLK